MSFILVGRRHMTPFCEWQRVSAGRMCDYSNFTWQQIEDANGLQWGGESLYNDGIFPTDDGRARLHSVPCDLS